jgi:hypothetical protein
LFGKKPVVVDEMQKKEKKDTLAVVKPLISIAERVKKEKTKPPRSLNAPIVVDEDPIENSSEEVVKKPRRSRAGRADARAFRAEDDIISDVE